jgi:hypothetical protein
MPTWQFAMRASEESWDQFLTKRPAPGYNELMAMVRFNKLAIEGTLYPFMSHFFYFSEIFKYLREQMNNE